MSPRQMNAFNGYGFKVVGNADWFFWKLLRLTPSCVRDLVQRFEPTTPMSLHAIVARKLIRSQKTKTPSPIQSQELCGGIYLHIEKRDTTFSNGLLYFIRPFFFWRVFGR